MKKFTLKSILLLSVAFMMGSCLDLEPKDQIADDNYWQTPTDFKLFANQFYGWTRDFGNSIYDGPHSDKRSDLIVDKGEVNLFSHGTNTVPNSDSNYGSAYGHIRRTNILLQNAESYANPADIAQFKGEALFFRAYSYFELLQLYGDAILVTTPIDVTGGELKAERNDRSEVADFIINDLQEAADLLPATANVESGRVGREGALGMLSRVALYEGTWQKFRENEARGKELLGIAVHAAKEVIEGGKFALFAPASLDDAAQKYLFILEDVKSNPAGITKSANTEYILARRHDETLSPIGKNITKECLANTQQIAHKLAAMYLCQDGLPIDKSPQFKGYAKMGDEYLNRDNRMANTLCIPGGTYWSNDKPRVNWTGDAADVASASLKNFSPTSGSGYHNQKWATERKVNSTYEGYDYPVIRLAEVMLNFAEALYERDGKISDTDLNKSLNKVRCRVNPKMPKLTNSFVEKNGLDFRTEIRRERTVELFNEGFRIDDLKRWKTAEVEMPQDVLGVKWRGTEYEQTWSKVTFDKNEDGHLIVETDREWDEKNYLLPLPTDQLQLNPNLKQNPGWEE